MALKAMLFLLACFLLVNIQVGAKAPYAAVPDYKRSPPPPSVKSPPPPAPVYKAPPPPAPVVKTPPPPPPPSWPPKTIKDCEVPCKERCKNHSRKDNVCLRACSTCCLRCKCVPPGQYGNREKCGTCYANMTTTGGKLKCP